MGRSRLGTGVNVPKTARNVPKGAWPVESLGRRLEVVGTALWGRAGRPRIGGIRLHAHYGRQLTAQENGGTALLGS